MVKVSNTEAELKKSVAYKKKRIIKYDCKVIRNAAPILIIAVIQIIHACIRNLK